MDTDERETYMEAIKRATTSKAFDRILHITTVIVFLAVAVFVVFQQSSYQDDVRGITEKRNQQLDQIQMSQENVNRATNDLKDYIACLKKLPVSPSDEQITACRIPSDL